MMESEVTMEKLEDSLKVIFDLVPAKERMNVFGHMVMIEHFAKRGWQLARDRRAEAPYWPPGAVPNADETVDLSEGVKPNQDAGEDGVIPAV